MSGHSHWANVKFKKEKEDQKKGKVFSKVSRQIIQAVRENGPDPEFNQALKMAIDEGKAANMPKDSINRAIEAGEEKGSSGQLEVFEGYGPAGVAFLVKADTDNRNRTVSEIRRIFDNYGGSLGEAGSAAFVFDGGTSKFQIELSENDRERVGNLVTSLEEHDDVIEVLNNAK